MKARIRPGSRRDQVLALLAEPRTKAHLIAFGGMAAVYAARYLQRCGLVECWHVSKYVFWRAMSQGQKRSNDGAVCKAQCCPQCDDGDGECAFPYYGAAPHSCGFRDGLPFVGSSAESPPDEWPANFALDPACGRHTGYPRAGTYTHCLACGAPNVADKRHGTVLRDGSA